MYLQVYVIHGDFIQNLHLVMHACSIMVPLKTFCVHFSHMTSVFHLYIAVFDHPVLEVSPLDDDDDVDDDPPSEGMEM